MMAGSSGFDSICGWGRERLEAYGNRLYKALVYHHHAVDQNMIVFRALCTTKNPQDLREIVTYLQQTLLAAEEKRAKHLHPGEIILTL
jgi:hypothetical protein